MKLVDTLKIFPCQPEGYIYIFKNLIYIFFYEIKEKIKKLYIHIMIK